MAVGIRPRRGSSHQVLARVAVVALVLNSALLGALSVLAFDPQRRAFGRATGLWHECVGRGSEHWSPALLILGVPIVLGLATASRLSKPVSTGVRLISGALAVVVVVFVLVPTGTCVA